MSCACEQNTGDWLSGKRRHDALADHPDRIGRILVHFQRHLVDELTCAGDLNDIDREIERLKKFEAGGVTDMTIRLFDDPMAGLKMIGERVVPAFS